MTDDEAKAYVDEIMRNVRVLAERNGHSQRDVLESLAESLPEPRRSELLKRLSEVL